MLERAITVKIDTSAHSEYQWVVPKECYALPNLIPDFHQVLKLTGYIN